MRVLSAIAHKAATLIKDFIRLKRRQVQSVGEKAVREGNLPQTTGAFGAGGKCYYFSHSTLQFMPSFITQL
ncbi:hypothetical protein NIES2130_32680 [Scytonema sp. HK-05]|nr:hypothetical protein NIES2130_32680 [Scytonema sp. HK-05]